MRTAGLTIWQNLRASLYSRPCTKPDNVLGFARRYASKAREDAASLENQKPKPKTATQLRRSASASLPIRANPTPTRSEIQPISILTTAERFVLPNLRPHLPQVFCVLTWLLVGTKMELGGKVWRGFCLRKRELGMLGPG